MLDDFIVTNREAIIARTQASVASRTAPESESGAKAAAATRIGSRRSNG